MSEMSNSKNIQRFYRGKYDPGVVQKTLKRIEKGIPLRTISKEFGIPETTIRNWKFGYTQVGKARRKFSKELQSKALSLAREGRPIVKIAQDLCLPYNQIRPFLKRFLSHKDYAKLKVVNPPFCSRKKSIGLELAYTIGVLFGDGYFDQTRIRLGTKDLDFASYFKQQIYGWCGKKPSLVSSQRNGKPYFECYLSWKDAVSFVRDLVGERKEIPGIFLNAKDLRIITMFLKGFFDSDGSIILNKGGNSGFLRLYNQKLHVLEQVLDLLEKLGFDRGRIKIRENNRAPGGPVYGLRIGGRDHLGLFERTIGFTIERKKAKLKRCLR